MQTKDYAATHYFKLSQINTENVEHLKVAWSFSTGVLHGHEGAPLVVNGVMYVHTPFPNNVYALDLDDSAKIKWQYKPKQNPAARAVACCDVVSRGLAYAPAEGKEPAKIFLGQLDGHLVALNAETGEAIWKMEVCDPAVGAKLNIYPGPKGVMGFVRAYDAKTGEFKWTVPERFAVWGGTLATKGNLVF